MECCVCTAYLTCNVLALNVGSRGGSGNYDASKEIKKKKKLHNSQGTLDSVFNDRDVNI